MSILSLRISFLHVFYKLSFSDYVYRNVSSWLFYSVRSHFFSLLRTYASFFFSNVSDRKGILSFAYRAVKNFTSISSLPRGLTRCIRSLRNRLRFFRLGSVLRRSGYVTLLSRRFRTSYRPKKRRSKIRNTFVTAALSVLPSYVARSFLFLPVAQQVDFGTTSKTVFTAQTPFRRSIAANTYSDYSRLSVTHVRRALRRALNNMFRSNRWILRFFPAFKGRRIVSFLYTLFTRTTRSRRSFSSIRTRIWYLVNQHARRPQTYAPNIKRVARRIRKMNKKQSYLHVTQKDYSGSVRTFSLSYFLNTHYNMSVQDLIAFCKSACKFNGSLSSVMFLMERTLPLFLSNNFMINTGLGVRVNNVSFEPMSGHKGPFISVGDLMEFGCIVKQNCSSLFAPLFVIFFNVLLTSRSFFFRTRLLSVIVSMVKLFMFRRKKVLRVLRRRKARIPVVRSALLGDFYGVDYNPVSYFIRSRATSHTHMLRALSRKKGDLVDVSGKLGFIPFVRTMVRTNKSYVAEFLEIFGPNCFWTLQDACLQNLFYDLVRCHVFASFTYSAAFTRCFFNDLYISGSVSTFLDRYSQRKRITLESLLPVFLYTNYTRFILEPPMFTNPDVFMYSKRYFTFYGTAILAYKRNTEMSHFDTSREANRFYLSHNVNKIQQNIRKHVSHNSIRSVQLSRVKQTIFVKRIRRVFRLWRRRYRMSRRRRLMLMRKARKHKYNRTVLPVSLRTSRVVRTSLLYFYTLYRKYYKYYKIPSQTRSRFRIRPDNNDYSKLKIFGMTRDYYVRSVNTPLMNSRHVQFNSYYTGSSSFQEPHFFPGVQRFFFTGGRLCSSVSFLFSKDIIKSVPKFSNSAQALLFRLDDERAVATRGIRARRSMKRLFSGYDSFAAREARFILSCTLRGSLRAEKRRRTFSYRLRIPYIPGIKSKQKNNYSKQNKYNSIQHNNNNKMKRSIRRLQYKYRRRRRKYSRKWLRNRPFPHRTYRLTRRRMTLSPYTVILKLLRLRKKKKFRRRHGWRHRNFNYFGNSFERSRRIRRYHRHSRFFWRRRARFLWRLRAIFRKNSTVVLPLFDNEEQTVRLLHDDRFAIINSLADLQAATKHSAKRSALASAFLSRYLRERLIIEHVMSRKLRSRIKRVPVLTDVKAKAKTSFASPAVRSTFTSRELVGYQLRLNAARRQDRAQTKKIKLFFSKRVTEYTNNPPTYKRYKKQHIETNSKRKKHSSRLYTSSKRYGHSIAKNRIEHRNRTTNSKYSAVTSGKDRATNSDKYRVTDSVKSRANSTSSSSKSKKKPLS